MIYHLSLRTAGLVAGALLVCLGLLGFAFARRSPQPILKFPRSRVAGVVLLSLAFVWSMWLLATMEMGEFSSFRRPLLVGVPIAFVLVLRFLDEFLAARALGMLCLLAAEPLIDAAFLRYEGSRLVVTVLAYLLVVAGILWVTMPYLLRDQLNWSRPGTNRWRALNLAAVAYGAAMLILAFTRY